MSTSTEVEFIFTDEDSTRILDFWFKDVPEFPSMETTKRWFQVDAAFDEACRVYTVTDPLALAVSQHAISPARRFDLGPGGAWRGIPTRRCWFYLPLEHAEDLGAHQHGLELHEELIRDCKGGEGEELAGHMEEFSKAHTEVIKRFGRYPYRNQALGRENTKEEAEWLEKEKSPWAR
ncbi:hypothetical protein C7212DRAFT_358501 [Tuber magnatum]|uniref:DUF924-domain-containing protein n=1 Tax=Tuber magnatum TaxID=42249 RepID=A0A317SMD7_9PEZI|nr:hypothetical protein C7212DRAFT_358501 [Tuber magnatum]